MSANGSSRAVARALQQFPIKPHFSTSKHFTVRSGSSLIRTKHHAVWTAPAYSRNFSVERRLFKEDPNITSGISAPTQYAFQDIQELSKHPSSSRILIDVREPGELLQTGRIPTAKSIPVSSAPDAFFMPEEDFESKFGFSRPSSKQEVIFYCKSGVRSRTASLLAGQAGFGGKIGNYGGSWLDWEKNGGASEKEGEQGDNSTVTGSTNPGQGAPGASRP